MNKQAKKELIERWYREGKIKILGHGCYSVSSEGFLLRITPELVNKVLAQKLERR